MFNTDTLIKLGFTFDEINIVDSLLKCGYEVTASFACNFNIPYYEIPRLQYLYSILIGKTIININSIEDLSRHYKRLNCYNGKISINDFPQPVINDIKKIPRFVVVNGLPEGKYSIYNSKNNKRMILHRLIKEDKDTITFSTNIKPQFTTESEKCLYFCKDIAKNRIHYTENKDELNRWENEERKNKQSGIAVEVKDMSQKKGNVFVTIHKRYAKIARPYVILCSLTKPKCNNLGMYQMVFFEGTIVYIYAVYYDVKSSLPGRIYYWGFKDMNMMLEKVARNIFSYGGVHTEYLEGTEKYSPIEK